MGSDGSIDQQNKVKKGACVYVCVCAHAGVCVCMCVCVYVCVCVCAGFDSKKRACLAVWIFIVL